MEEECCKEIIASLSQRAQKRDTGQSLADLACILSKYDVRPIVSEEQPFPSLNYSSPLDALITPEGVEESATLNPATTPLHVACRLHDYAAIALLLAHGANVNICDGQGRTVLYIAVNEHDVPMVSQQITSTQSYTLMDMSLTLISILPSATV